VSFGLKNTGTADTTNLVATRLASGGILAPSGPQTYGVLNANGAALAQAFTFTAIGNCGDTNTASLQLQDGATSLGTVAFSFRLGQPTDATVFSENFDGITAPALPAGWATSASGAESAWVASSSSSDTSPNAAFSPDPANIGESELDSPPIALPAGSAQLTFQHNYNLERTYDGGVLEIRIGGGAWTDILEAGGSFVSGGYNYTLSSYYSNPLSGRQAWSGDSGGFIATVVNLPPAASGQTIQLRWLCGSDDSISAPGWYVDTISITNTTVACCTPSTKPPPTPAILLQISLARPQISISFTSQLGTNYLLEYKHFLDDPAWTPLSPAVPGTGGPMTLQHTNTSADSGYYRLQRQ
jgi:hypothetical protein